MIGRTSGNDPGMERTSRHERGQTMTEYAAVLGVITIVIVIALAALSDTVASLLEAAIDAIT